MLSEYCCVPSALLGSEETTEKGAGSALHQGHVSADTVLCIGGGGCPGEGLSSSVLIAVTSHMSGPS